ncbi:unnamed protein product [Rotaria socialis]|uniref:Major facilitator superfamily (MFS) profile domain-containing protein n=1 Tax=Rotaria socialis TaxID=392032 RepID=A0A818BWF6_9BILA|nr:unnamed protein product [Rotaria socialis]
MILVTITFINKIRSQRVLFVSIPSLSHFNGLLSIGRALADYHRDVSITFAVFDNFASLTREKLPSSKLILLGSLSSNEHRPIFSVRNGETPLQFMARISMHGFLAIYEQMHDGLVNANIVDNYDLLIINMFAFAAQDLAHDLGIPFVIYSLTSVEGVFNLPSWIPRGFDSHTQGDLQKSLLARLNNYLVEPLRIIFYLGPHMVELDRLRRNNNRTRQGIHPLLGNPVERWQGHPIFIAYPMALDFRRSYTPNYHFLGFTLDEQDTNRVSNESCEIEAWVNETQAVDEFVMVVALGSISVITENTWLAIIDSLRFLPNMRMLLGVRDENCRNFVLKVASKFDRHRLMIQPWIPQRRILSNPNVRIFLCHGGLYSIGEAVYAHKPLIILPGFGDQRANAARMRSWNVAVVLERHSMTAAVLAQAARYLVENDRFAAITECLKRLHYFSEREGGGTRRAAQLIEGWMIACLQKFWTAWRNSHLLAVFIVFVAFFLDSVLFTCVIPIIPDYLNRIDHPQYDSLDKMCSQNMTNNLCLILNNMTNEEHYRDSALNSSTAKNLTDACAMFNENLTLQLMPEKCDEMRQELIHENGPIGLLFASKSFMQLVTNPIVGIITDRIGYTILMLLGFGVMFISILMFAFADTYWLLFTSRAIQGIGSSFSTISGASMLSKRFPDDMKRGKMIAHATSGVALGVAVGPVFGGILYHHFGKTVPFLILAAVALIDGLLRLSIISTKRDSETEKLVENTSTRRTSSMFTLIRDPLICIAIGASMMTLIGVAMLEGTLPIHLMVSMKSATPLEQGLVFLPMSVALFISQNAFGYLGFYIRRWLCGMIGLGVVAVAFFLIPLMHSVVALIGPQVLLGTGIGMVMSTIGPTLAQLVDLRYSSADYGNAFALFETGLCVSFLLGMSSKRLFQ